MRLFALLVVVIVFCETPFIATAQSSGQSSQAAKPAVKESRHLTNLRQITFGGDNAEAYFGANGQAISFQSNNPKWGLQCDQIFYLPLADSLKMRDSAYRPARISTGRGRTTCSYIMPDGKHVLFGSTHRTDSVCTPMPVVTKPEYLKKYLWAVHRTYDIYVAALDGNNMKPLATTSGYDAEATISPKGDKIVFTSDRSGDLELWTMNVDGTNQKQITSGLGYDGGAFFSPDGKQLVFRASRPTTPEEIAEYKELLSMGLVAPTNMEIYTCNVDGSNLRQITHLGKANWAPFFHPSGKKIIFASNHHSTRGYDFQLYMVNTDGTGLEQITGESIFNAFPMFSPDGKKLIFSSNRSNGGTRDTNLFIADWVD
ncbi:MAG: PD40 domain-containing protein [Ignavibacteria bacterium]|nr:PD40 domain-containing protein [Ignavibacteria bacterium]